VRPQPEASTASAIIKLLGQTLADRRGKRQRTVTRH
jgi:hypothetical protein